MVTLHLVGGEMPAIRVLVADDHPAFREGFCRCLRDEPDLEVIGDSSTGEETIALARELKPDVVVIDVNMPGMNGIEAARLVKQECPTAAVLMVSAFSYQAYILGSLQAGASGYILKTAPLAKIIAAIRMVRDGQGVFDLKATSAILSRLSDGNPAEASILNDLHPRQLDILKLTAKGMSNKEIASQLGISDRTVQTHLVSVFRKLGVSSRTEAVLHALREGWITMDELYSGKQ